MGERTKIEWTDATYNPWRGCDKVSPGCANCYMFRDQERYGRDPSVVVRCSDSTFYAPLRKREWRELAPGSLVFTCSWSDWFHEDADGWRDEAWEVLRRRPDLRWQILTKRPERIAEHLPADWGDGWPNVWLGVSIENRRFVGRADVLRGVPAAVRFVSAEPLLGPLLPLARVRGDRAAAGLPEFVWEDDKAGDCPGLDLAGIDWLIAGGESGPGCRPMNLEWVRDLRDACRALDRECAECAGTGWERDDPDQAEGPPCGACDDGMVERGPAFFFKQLGGARSGTPMEALPVDLRVRDFPANLS